MCLGVVGRVATLASRHPDLVSVEVAGVVREINIVILREEGIAVGDWVLIHAGFALDKLDEASAKERLATIAAFTRTPEGT